MVPLQLILLLRKKITYYKIGNLGKQNMAVTLNVVMQGLEDDIYLIVDIPNMWLLHSFDHALCLVSYG